MGRDLRNKDHDREESTWVLFGVCEVEVHYTWSNMKTKDIIVSFARYDYNPTIIPSSQELRYSTDGEHWTRARSLFTQTVENVSMGMNYYIQFTATDNRSSVLFLR